MAIQGIIRPPPEIRAVADKTAAFVAKNGRGFESRIMNSAKGKTPKFAFLHDNSPFHAYYEDRITFYSNGGADEKKEDASTDKDKNEKESKKTDEGESPKEGSTVSEKQQVTSENEKTDAGVVLTARKAKSIVDPVARELLAQRARIQAFMDSEKRDEGKSSNQNGSSSADTPKEATEILTPPVQQYSTIFPPKNVTLTQLEIIKLTAQFVALNGKGGSFLRELTVKEWQNPMWGFLQPRHGHYAYFAQLIDLYKRLLREAVLIHEQETKTKDKQEVKEEKAENKPVPDTETTQISMLELASLKKTAGIDVATDGNDETSKHLQLIVDTAGNVSKCLEHAAYHSEFDRYYEEKRKQDLESMDGKDGIGGASRIDWHDFVVVETITFPVDEVVEMAPPPPPPAPKVKEPAPKISEADAMDESSDEEDNGEKITVVDDYAPKVVSSQAKFASEARTHVIDPITKKSIPIADMTEHMRIQLLDPKWAAEKAKFLEKQKESNLVSGGAIARNMDAFAKARTDIFGSSAQATNTGDDSRSHLESSRIAHELPQMPQPRPTDQTSHARPDMPLPDAKRVRTEMAFPTAQETSHPIPTMAVPPPPTMAPVPPPPPAAASVAFTEPPPAATENDTETMETSLSEADFAKSLSDPNITLVITIPNDSTYASWNFNGQQISVGVNVMSKVKSVKQEIQSQLGGMPVNKMQLKHLTAGFLKDNVSLAYLNIGPNNNTLELLPKVRSGRRR